MSLCHDSVHVNEMNNFLGKAVEETAVDPSV